jgi:hypothetical protein
MYQLVLVFCYQCPEHDREQHDGAENDDGDDRRRNNAPRAPRLSHGSPQQTAAYDRKQATQRQHDHNRNGH